MEAWEMFENLRVRCEELFCEKLMLRNENRTLLEQIARMKVENDALRIAEIKALCEAATPGPWTVRRSEWECDCTLEQMNACDASKEPRNCENGCCIEPAWIDAILTLYNGDYDGMNDADANFIAAARQIIPELLEALEESTREYNMQIDSLRNVRDEWHKLYDQVVGSRLNALSETEGELGKVTAELKLRDTWIKTCLRTGVMAIPEWYAKINTVHLGGGGNHNGEADNFFDADGTGDTDGA